MRYVLGLDIGIASVGWAILNLDDKRVERLGVRAFNKAENPKNGAPLAEPRRLARSVRRRLRRRSERLHRAKDLFVEYGLIAERERDTAFITTDARPDPWCIRAEGLDRLLTGEEFARALFHIIKRRGFKSNRKSEAAEETDGRMKASISANLQYMNEHGYRTAGEMFYLDERFKGQKRNSRDFYENAVDRPTLESEIKLLFNAQRGFGSKFGDATFESRITDVFLWQMPFAKGDDLLKKIGYCSLEKDQPRAPQHSYYAERAMLLGKVNSLNYFCNGNKCYLERDQRDKVVNLAYSKVKVTYADLRKVINLPADARFTGLTYMRRKTKGEPLVECVEECEKSSCVELKGFHTLRKAFGKNGLWKSIESNPDLMDQLTYALTFFKTDNDIQEYLSKNSVDDEIARIVLTCQGLAKTAKLSTIALRKILPHLEEGCFYSDACAKAGYNHSSLNPGIKFKKLPSIDPDTIRNPVVLRGLTQARKVVNAVIDRYGSPYRIHIELARDMGKSRKDRDEITRHQKENEAEAERERQRFRDLFNGREPNGTDLIKLRLYNEQQGKCAYSQQSIDINRLWEPHYVEIDHVVPYSRSFDDSRSNKVLVLWSENQKKGNKIPFEAFGHDARMWAAFDGWVRAIYHDRKKRDNLLRTSFDDKLEKEWRDRNLNDTRWICRAFMNHVQDNLLFADAGERNPVICVNGHIVSKARGMWGIKKDREEDDLHHAVDAAVIASLLQYQVKMITEHAKVGETRISYKDDTTGEVIEWVENKRPRLPQPWNGFRDEVLSKVQDVMVSRMPQHSASGAIHEDTIRSSRTTHLDGKSSIRKPLNGLKADDLNNLYAPETNEKLYSAIRERMVQFDNDAKKAFAEPLYKPTNDGSQGHIVKSVKVCQTQNSGIHVQGGIADNGDMIRTDVFRKPNGKGKYEYYLVPVYVSDRLFRKLPNKAIAANKSYDEWPVINDTYEFLFSLRPFDLVQVDDIVGYYHTVDRSNARIQLSLPNKTTEKQRASTKTATTMKKFAVGILGDYYPVRKEARVGLENGSSIKSCKTTSSK